MVPTRLSYTQPLKSSPGPVPDDAARGGRSSASSRRWTLANFFVLEVEAVNVR